ncbi:MAG: hypothetical protein P8Y39_04345 [Nitrospirota bacterium]
MLGRIMYYVLEETSKKAALIGLPAAIVYILVGHVTDGLLVFAMAWPGNFLTRWLVRIVRHVFDSKAENDINVDINLWRQLTDTGEGGAILGALERIVFFIALTLKEGYPLFIGAWLAFKVATKWEIWGNVIQVPGDGQNLRLRSLLGARVMMGFLVGTLTNILVAGLGVVIVS